MEGSKKFQTWINSKEHTLIKKIHCNSYEFDAVGISVNNIPFTILYFNNSNKLDHLNIGIPEEIYDGRGGEIRPFYLSNNINCGCELQLKDYIKENKEIIDSLEDIILEKISKNELEFDIYILNDKIQNKVKKIINNQRLTIVCLSILGTLKNITNSKVYKSIFGEVDYDINFDKSYIISDITYSLSIQEDYNNQRIRFNSWKDYIIANVMSMLKDKNVLPSTITIKKMIQYTNCKEFFNSKYVLDKYKISNKIENIDNEYEYYENNYNIMADVSLSYSFIRPIKNSKVNLDIGDFFKLLYTIWYLHSDLRIMHSKLSESIFIGQDETINKEYYDSITVNFSGEKDTYVFKSSGNICEIYNYGASILMLNSIILNKNERVPFDNSQLYYIINLINEYITVDLIPNDILKELEHDHWMDIFNILAAKDYIDICNFVLENTKNKIPEIQKIIKLSEDYIKEGLNNLINKKKRYAITINTLYCDRILPLFNKNLWLNTENNTKIKINKKWIYDETFNLHAKYKLKFRNI